MHSSDILKRIESEPWDSIGRMAMMFEVDFERQTKENRKLKKELQIIRHILREHLENPENNEKFLGGSFFVGIVKTTQKVEKAFENNGAKGKEMLVFLKAVVHKAKKEKMDIKKTMEKKIERQTDFISMKEMVDPDDAVQKTNKHRTD